jgi:hypothetical protein
MDLYSSRVGVLQGVGDAIHKHLAGNQHTIWDKACQNGGGGWMGLRVGARKPAAIEGCAESTFSIPREMHRESPSALQHRVWSRVLGYSGRCGDDRTGVPSWRAHLLHSKWVQDHLVPHPPADTAVQLHTRLGHGRVGGDQAVQRLPHVRLRKENPTQAAGGSGKRQRR